MIVIKKLQDPQDGRESIAIYDGKDDGIPYALVQYLQGRGFVEMRVMDMAEVQSAKGNTVC